MAGAHRHYYCRQGGRTLDFFVLGIDFAYYNPLYPDEQYLVDTPLALCEAVLLQVVGSLGLVSIPDLPVSACKDVIAEDLELAFRQNSVLLNLVFEAGYTTKLQLKVKAVILEGKANLMRKTEKRFVESENLQDLADQIAEMENLVWVAEIAVCLG